MAQPNLCAGDKFRNLRMLQISGHFIQADALYSSLNRNERYAFDRIYTKSDMRALAKALDELIPVVGLWEDFRFGAIKDFVYMRCTEELTCYVVRMRNTWKALLGEEEDFKSCADTATVRMLETLIPRFSSDDRMKIEALVNECKIFSQVACHEDRRILLDRLSNIPGRILTFHTLSYDGRYVLQSCSELLRELLPPFKQGSRGTVREGFLKANHGIFDNHEDIDAVANDASHTPEDSRAARGYCQLYLYVMRYGAAPRKPKGKHRTHCLHRLWWSKLAHQAASLGFSTPQIQALCTEDGVDEEVFLSITENPQFTTDSHPLPKAQRCGRPDLDILERYRHQLSLKVICMDIDGMSGRNVTWLGILRDIVIAFFGDFGIFEQPNPGLGTSISSLRLAPGPLHSESLISPARVTSSELFPHTTVQVTADPAERAILASSSVYSESMESGDELCNLIDTYCSAEDEFAPGFETSKDVPMEVFHYIPGWRKPSVMIEIFLESTEKPFVLYDYHSGEYAKYAASASGQKALDEALIDLANCKRIFIVFLDSDRFKVLSHRKVLKAAQPTRVVLVGRRGQLFSDHARPQKKESLLNWVDTFSGITGKRKRALDE
ncbi:hypothetical protein AJ80_09406 [Polytolypa hystricis UAMH7299]|uniref:Uncharacterized protein n=1 Tax=Polytolypa hystricis (strain UAMH7299) TaxID=1447883 RepID=A0A2B7WR97_POLH7|nr:hypothetical protein AJ80_09406 [Polytolypa hystricis UAMH7299]